MWCWYHLTAAKHFPVLHFSVAYIFWSLWSLSLFSVFEILFRGQWRGLQGKTRPRKLDISAIFSYMSVFIALKCHSYHHYSWCWYHMTAAKRFPVLHLSEAYIEGWLQECSKSDGCFSQYLIPSPWRRYEDYNISFCKQWKFRCHCSYEQWYLNLHCLQRGQNFKNMFELLQSCAQPSIFYSTLWSMSPFSDFWKCIWRSMKSPAGQN